MAKIWPTITGTLTSSLDILSIDDTDAAPTHQELSDGIASGMLYGAVIGTVRANMVAKGVFGDAGYKKYTDAKLGGLV